MAYSDNLMFVGNSLKNKNKIKEEIYYCNFETIVHLSMCYAACYCILNRKKDFCLVNSVSQREILEVNKIESVSNNLLDSFIKDCFDIVSSKKKVVFVFYDFSQTASFLIINNLLKNKNYKIKLITRENLIYKCVLLKSKGSKLKVVFRDSFLLTQVPLLKLASSFGIKKKLITKVNYLSISVKETKFINQLKYICVNNCVIFEESFSLYIYSVFKLFNVNLIHYLSLSSLSLNIYKSKFHDSKRHPIEVLKGNKEFFVRKSYIGGIVDVYKPYLKDGYHYDINSLYPFIMMNYDMPVGVGKLSTDSNFLQSDAFFGFLDVTVVYLSFDKTSNIPFLPFFDENKGLLSAKGIWRGTYFSEEIKYAKKLGYLIIYHKGLSYERGKIFKNFVKTIYDIRLKNRNTPLEYTTKLILNSLYGRFGMQSESTVTSIFDRDEIQKMKEKLFLFDLMFIQEVGNKIILKMKSTPSLDKLNKAFEEKIIDRSQYNFYMSFVQKKSDHSNVAVQIASSITAYARLEMHKYKVLDNYQVYYSDTDSLFLDKPLPANFVSDKLIGKFKLEGEVKEAFFAAPKLYTVTYKNEISITKAKGLSSVNIEESFIKDIIFKEKKDIPILHTNFFRDFKDFLLYKEELKYTLSGNLLKRKKTTNLNNTWIGTKPFYIFQYKDLKIVF